MLLEPYAGSVHIGKNRPLCPHLRSFLAMSYRREAIFLFVTMEEFTNKLELAMFGWMTLKC